ncbi:histidine--tRNA ligase [Mycoplasma buteonis]|uniref:histidine--tRNA ligase n=1 Tax=Mycoplasma buteonis TaxID=171280 RepID=UPI00056B96F1|nr:histidine--tRNA ligase [Mycoplasma buteonis]
MISKIKGTKDYNPVDFEVKKFIQFIFEDTVNKFGFLMVETPIIESTNLFKRSVGDDSEIATKEMYEFLDKGKREICLRPEGTASFVRALIENKWFGSNWDKFAYFGPMFRYEQPQKGRYRQFYQAGVEFVGEKNYFKDAEIILMAQILLNNLEVETILKINTIGDLETRNRYEKALIEYFKPYVDQLSEDSQRRLKENKALRILDDKVDSKLEIVQNAPMIFDYLSDESKEYFTKLTDLLTEWGIEFEIAHELVRGLDYYDEIVFEFVSTDKNTGSQSTLIGGGRYSNLIKQLGGPELSSIGFGFGVDRLISIIGERVIEQNEITTALESASIYVAASENDENLKFLHGIINNYIRAIFSNVKIEYELIKSKKIFDRAKKVHAQIIICDDKNLEQKNLLLAKHLDSNDKIMFAKNEQGIIDLVRFMAEKEIDDVDVDQVEELIEGVFGNE